MSPRPLTLLVVLDGYGHRDESAFNAIAAAQKPTLDALWNAGPSTLLRACGGCVGLPEGQMGNSEVGHMTLGAGRSVDQELTALNRLVSTDGFAEHAVFKKIFEQIKTQGSALHLMGLCSPGGVHAHEDHLLSVLKNASRQGVRKIFLHLFLDGRDTPPRSAEASLRRCESLCVGLPGQVAIASIIGRYYAMDRDQRWERTEKAYRLLVEGEAPFRFKGALEALEAAYARGEGDEFVQASLIEGGLLPEPEDVLLFMNFRADRARQLSVALVQPDFLKFKRKTKRCAALVTLTTYAPDLPCSVIFPKATLRNTLGEWLALHQKKQLRISETEKFAHVTFFFNGGNNTPYPGEDRCLIPSPKVSTYDQQPQMSAPALTQALIEAIQSQQYDFILCNYPNADMVGHTGRYDAAVEAIQALDRSLTAVVAAVDAQGGQLVVTADHGNAELMFDEQTQQPHTAHTTSRVPCIYRGPCPLRFAPEGSLADVAPTLLALMGLPVPAEMLGRNLLQ